MLCISTHDFVQLQFHTENECEELKCWPFYLAPIYEISRFLAPYVFCIQLRNVFGVYPEATCTIKLRTV